MAGQARPEPAAAAEQDPARSTREEAAQEPARELTQPSAQDSTLDSALDSAQALAQGPAQVLVPEIFSSPGSAPALAPAPELAEAASPAWPAESANWKKPNCTACSDCSPSSVKLNQPRIRIWTRQRGG